MANQNDLDSIYMQSALLQASLSKANRKKVGAVLVTHQGIIIPGFNGTAKGLSNACEGEDGTTLPTVIHAELNTVLKAAKEGVSVLGSTLYVSLSPCVSCSAMLIQAGVRKVLYHEPYRDTKGIELLAQSGIEVVQFSKGTLWSIQKN